MNKILTASLLALTLISLDASARSLRPLKMEAKLLSFQIDPNLTAAQNIESGIISHDLINNQLVLDLTPSRPCTQDHEICIAMMPIHFVVSLPVVSVETDSCGSRTITALVDRRPVDGAMERLTLVDNGGFHCEVARMLPQTEVKYETSAVSRRTGAEISSHSHFFGDRLETKFFE